MCAQTSNSGNHPWRSAPMSNQRRRFLGIAAGAIAVPGTSGLLVAQGDSSRAREEPTATQTSVPERSAKSELTGLSALLTPEESIVVLIDHQPFQFANLHSHASIFPREIFCPPKEWAEALWPNLFYWNELDKGGHFAAFEQPQLFAGEMRNAFKSRRG